jgi:DedD protein
VGSGAPKGSGDTSGSGVAKAPSGGDSRGTPPSDDDDQPRSAFGPNAVQRPKPAADATSGSARSAGSSPSTRTSVAAEPSRPAASEAKVTKGWAVQLGVFASRDNAERLAKQVKGKGYTVSVNETSGNGKRLYRVRVGPEATRAAAVELGAKLRAAGHTGAVVAWP